MAVTQRDISVGASETWTDTFSGDFAAADWKQLLFVVKRRADSDEDREALLVVRLSNPGAANDGLIQLEGQDSSADKAQAAITAGAGISAAAAFTVLLHPRALNLPPGDWRYDAFVFTGAVPDKRRIGTGKFSVARTSWRGPIAP